MNEVRKLDRQLAPWGNTFQVEGRAGVKVLRHESSQMGSGKNEAHVTGAERVKGEG